MKGIKVFTEKFFKLCGMFENFYNKIFGENIKRKRVIYLLLIHFQHQLSSVLQNLLSTNVQMDKPSGCKGVIRAAV